MDWLKYIYEKFFMRDLLGKVTPGSIELYALVYLAGVDQRVDVAVWPWPMWFLAAAAALVTGLGFQILAEWIGIHSASPRPRRILLFFSVCKKWRQINDDSRIRQSMTAQATEQQWTPNAETLRERYVYLKEGSGNLGTAVLVAIPVVYFQNAYIGPTLFVGFAIVLVATHFVHAHRQAEHELTSLWCTATDTDESTKKRLKAMACRLKINLDKEEHTNHQSTAAS